MKAPDLDPTEVQPAVEALAEAEAKAKAEAEAAKPVVYRPWVPKGAHQSGGDLQSWRLLPGAGTRKR